MPAKKKIGIVIGTKMEKTVVIKVENRHSHTIYSKTLVKTKKYLVHDELGICQVGDKIVVEESRPLSKRKRWKLIEILPVQSFKY